MQTFLPFADFQESAKCLDYRRLGKQRVECRQILTALDNKRLGIKSGWQNHPAARMWEGYEITLAMYSYEICKEWRSRGYKDTLLEYFEELMNTPRSGPHATHPNWLGDERLHASHRGRLLFKDPAYYGQFGWTDAPRSEEEGYWWPVDLRSKVKKK